MRGRGRRATTTGAVVLTLGLAMLATPASAGSGPDDRAREVADHWTAERIEAAQPRDLVLDERGRAHVRGRDGQLTPHGHGARAQGTSLRAVPMGKPDNPGGGKGGGGGNDGGGGGGGSDVTGPMVSGLTPSNEQAIGTSHTFSATVTDESGVKSVEFHVAYPTGTTPQVFPASNTGGDTWSTTLSGFTTAAQGTWWVVAKDRAKKGGNTSTSGTATFVAEGDTGGGGGGGGDVVNGHWPHGGAVQTAAGRLYFEMRDDTGLFWVGYVCSGTVADDATAGRSVIITAAHCVYDDVAKEFARNVLFIPDQDGTSGSGTDRNCGNDPLGCWIPTHGVVDADWTTRQFPDNIAWDYGYYVVPDSGAHAGTSTSSDALDVAAGDLPVQFTTPSTGVFTHALGYSYIDDPNFMYCAEDMGTNGSANWWLDACGLSGGSSGGPWIQPMDTATGAGPIVSVNSWGYTNRDGMAGPKLSGSSAQCLFMAAKGGTTNQARGLVPSNC